MESTENAQWQLSQWVDEQLPEPVLNFNALPGDASFRRYFRARGLSASYIAALAPPAQENNAAFVAVAELLRKAGVLAPAVLAADLQRGFLLLTDLGDQLLLNSLSPDNVDNKYQLALQELLKMQKISVDADLPAYSGATLLAELGRFQEWFINGLLEIKLSNDDRQIIEQAQRLIVDSADSQPRVFVHRDFQSRNLMPQKDGSLAVIDFQDAAIGSMTYDLASLLRDTHIDWPASLVREWALGYARLARDAGILPDSAAINESRFLRWFDLDSLERNITVLGTFSRLHLRDAKSGYLQHLPRLLHYIFAVAANYPEFTPFLSWFEQRLMPTIRLQDWWGQQSL